MTEWCLWVKARVNQAPHLNLIVSQIKVTQHVHFTDLLLNTLDLIVVQLEDLQLLQGVDCRGDGSQSVVAEVELGEPRQVRQRVGERLQLVVVEVKYQKRSQVGNLAHCF